MELIGWIVVSLVSFALGVAGGYVLGYSGRLMREIKR